MTPGRPRVPSAGPALPVPSAWARERISAARAVGPVPGYGSPEWDALADEDPRKVAAALVAAEVQRYEAATMVERLRAEVDAARYAAEVAAVEQEIEDGARAAMARDEVLAAKCQQLGRDGAAQLLGRRPTAAELAERRREASPRPVTTSPASRRRWPSVAWPAADPRGQVVPAGRPGGGVPSVWVTMRPPSA